MNRSNTLFVVSLIGLALSAAILILLIPPVFTPDGSRSPLLMVTLAVAAVLFGAGTRRWRPSRS